MSNVISKEWVVEQYWDGVLRVIGKVIPKVETMFLNNADLENIWDLANWGSSQPLQFVPRDETYRGCKCFMHEGDASLGYVDMGKTSCCNDDIFIRRHNDTERGFWIRSNRRAKVSGWVYTSRAEFVDYMRSNARFL